MAKDIQRHALCDYESKRKRYISRKFIIGFVVLANIIAGFAYFYRMNTISYHAYKVLSSVQNKGEASGYISYKGGVIKYSRNGATAYGKEGKVLWNDSYEMSDPIADVCGKYAVISDRGGKLIYIFNEKGRIGSVMTLYDISKVEIASQGVVAVQMCEEDDNYVNFYYADGTIVMDNKEEATLVDMKKNIMDNGYLMDIALSEDGKKLAVDFYVITTGKMLSNIGFYNYGEVGQNEVDNFMGGFSYKDIIIPRITFLRNDMVCAFKENGFMIYSMPEKPELIEEQTFDHDIQSVLYNDKYVGVVLKEEGMAPGQLLLYDLKGKKILDQKLDFAYNKILLSENEIIMYDNNTCLILRANGKEKFKYTFDTKIEAIYSSNHMNKYVLVTASDISEIKLSK